jgi:hypothetical protein
MKDRFFRFFPAKVSGDQAKDSGLAVVLILLIIGLIINDDVLFRIAAAALLMDMIFPMFYYPFAIFWFGISGLLGAIFSKVFLSVIYFIIVVPVALLRRMLGKDPLSLRRFKDNSESVMRSRHHIYNAADLEKPF